MFKCKWLVVLVLLFIAVQPSFGGDRPQIHGVWKLVSYNVET
jgi:hypothetical protein